jgi:mannose-6-phosphate isomerase-like protein (cupin superfamily)
MKRTQFRMAAHFQLALLLLALFQANLKSLAQELVSAETQPLAINLAEINWGPAGGGNGFPVGVRTERQGTDPVTGGITYYAMFPSGSHFDLHWHTYDEHVVVVQGSVTIVLGEQSHSLGVGSYVVIPGKMNHSWDIPQGEDAVIVVRRGGPADFHFVDQ